MTANIKDSSSRSVPFFDFIIDKLNSTDGISSALRIGEYSTRWLMLFPVSRTRRLNLQNIGDLFFKSNTVIGAFGLVEQVRDCHHTYQIIQGNIDDAVEKKSLLEKVGTIFKRTLSTVNAVSDVANNFQDAGFVSLGKGAQISSGLFAATDIVLNTMDISDEFNAISVRGEEALSNDISPVRKNSLAQKNYISKWNIFKNTIGIAGSVISLAAIFVSSSIAVPMIGLSLSTLWLATKLYTQYMGKDLK
jgi:hypothetical protein